jgi:hypothetical protein
MRVAFITAASAIALVSATSAGATIVIGAGPGTLQPPENVLFTNNPAPGTTITGVTNQTNSGVTIRGGEVLVGNGGQARVEASDGLISSMASAFGGLPASQLSFDLTDPNLGFTSTEFRIFVGSGTATSATLTFLDTQGESFTNTFDILPNGFFNARAIDGQVIDRFSFTTNGTFEDVRQVRVGGVAAVPNVPGAVVPEPATWGLMILGFGGTGAMLRQARRRSALALA